jgi:glutamine synthetase
MVPHKILKSISDQIHHNNLLEYILQKLYQDFGLTAVLGAEIEFYIIDDSINHNVDFRNFVEQNSSIITKHYPIKLEKGHNQFEIDIFPQKNIQKTLAAIAAAKLHLSSLPNISLHPKPYPDDYGNAMHFHINFLDVNGDNFFDHSYAIEHAARSLCHFLPEHFLIFAPKADHYARFDKKFMAPTHISFGGNNRSVAIRIPDVKPRRLEHRVSSPETDEYLATYAILHAIYQGLTKPQIIGKHSKIHGNAFDKQYELERFPLSIEEAIKKIQM